MALPQFKHLHSLEPRTNKGEKKHICAFKNTLNKKVQTEATDFSILLQEGKSMHRKGPASDNFNMLAH
jgi:hypothetical protein